MKKIFLLLILIAVVRISYGQITEYKINTYCERYYDNDMEVFGKWSEWKPLKIVGDDGSKDIFEITLSISQNAVKIQMHERNYDAGGRLWDASWKTYLCKFQADIASKDFSLDKSCTITLSSWCKGCDAINDRKGTGQVYAKTTVEQLIGGTFKGEIYILAQYDNGLKANLGFKIE